MPKVPRQRRRRKRPPKGFELLEERLDEFRARMREAENDDDEEKRRVEKMWGITRVHHERTRYVWDQYVSRAISREVYEWCLRERIADGLLIAKWKKGPGFENLCCLVCIDSAQFQAGTKCICRAPRASRPDESKVIECRTCGCRGCC